MRKVYYCLVPQLETEDKVVYFEMKRDGHFTGIAHIRTKDR